jgi:hypothetical protein
MKTAAIILFGFAALATVVAIKNVFGGGPNSAERIANSAEFVGFIVGSFLVPIVLLIAGLICLNKSKQR